MQMWQSRVEIEGYFFAYFECIAAFEAPYCWTSSKGGAHIPFVDSLDIHAPMKHVWAPPLTEVQWYGASNTAMRLKYATFDFCTGLLQIIYRFTKKTMIIYICDHWPVITIVKSKHNSSNFLYLLVFSAFLNPDVSLSLHACYPWSCPTSTPLWSCLYSGFRMGFMTSTTSLWSWRNIWRMEMWRHYRRSLWIIKVSIYVCN